MTTKSGKRHNLPMIDSLDDDAVLNEHGMHYQGKEDSSKKEIAKELEKKIFSKSRRLCK
jgi:valyl-tRNA synthetase